MIAIDKPFSICALRVSVNIYFFSSPIMVMGNMETGIGRGPSKDPLGLLIPCFDQANDLFNFAFYWGLLMVSVLHFFC